MLFNKNNSIRDYNSGSVVVFTNAKVDHVAPLIKVDSENIVTKTVN